MFRIATWNIKNFRWTCRREKRIIPLALEPCLNNTEKSSWSFNKGWCSKNEISKGLGKITKETIIEVLNNISQSLKSMLQERSWTNNEKLKTKVKESSIPIETCWGSRSYEKPSRSSLGRRHIMNKRNRCTDRKNL